MPSLILFLFKPGFKAMSWSPASSKVTNERFLGWVWFCFFECFLKYYCGIKTSLMNFSPWKLLNFFDAQIVPLLIHGSLDSFLTCHEGFAVHFYSSLEAGGQDRCWQCGAGYTQAQLQCPILPISWHYTEPLLRLSLCIYKMGLITVTNCS